jgi:hypothetical protein
MRAQPDPGLLMISRSVSWRRLLYCTCAVCCVKGGREGKRVGKSEGSHQYFIDSNLEFVLMSQQQQCLGVSYLRAS